MSKEEIKFEINKVLDRFSDRSLEEILYYLKEVDNTKSFSVFNTDALNKILLKDRE